jgi:hypothetical protein
MNSPHVIEPELTGPTPRAVGYRDGCATGCGLWFLRLFTLPHTIIGIAVLCSALWSTGLTGHTPRTVWPQGGSTAGAGGLR